MTYNIFSVEFDTFKYQQRPSGAFSGLDQPQPSVAELESAFLAGAGARDGAGAQQKMHFRLRLQLLLRYKGSKKIVNILYQKSLFDLKCVRILEKIVEKNLTVLFNCLVLLLIFFLGVNMDHGGHLFFMH